MTLYIDDNNHVTSVDRVNDYAVVTYLKAHGDLTTAGVEDTGNGFIVCFPAVHSTQQDYYVCLDYSQARDLVLGLAEFKKQLGFQE